MTAQTSTIKGMKNFFPKPVDLDASMSCGDCGEVCVGMNAIIICGSHWLLRMALFAAESSRSVSRGTHRGFGSTRRLFAGAANQHGIKRFVNGRPHAIKKSAA